MKVKSLKLLLDVMNPEDEVLINVSHFERVQEYPGYALVDREPIDVKAFEMRNDSLVLKGGR